jgi:hypothetical protein
MSCRELERLFVAGAPLTQGAAHRRDCPECESVARDVARVEGMTAGLRPPVWRKELRRSLLAIPQMTVSCEGAAFLLAEKAEGEIRAADAQRLEGHLSRCAGCSEAALVLASAAELTAPAPPPWLTTRLAAVRPEKKRRGWRMLLSGKAVIVYAYAAAIVVMLLGWNPTAVVKKASFASLGVSTRNAVTVAQHSVGDRLGAFQERAARQIAVWKGHVGGYGRAAVSNAIGIVWRPESKKTPAKPRLGRERGDAMGQDAITAAGISNREPFPARFRV